MKCRIERAYRSNRRYGDWAIMGAIHGGWIRVHEFRSKFLELLK